MTDLEKFKALFNSVGCEFTTTHEDYGEGEETRLFFEEGKEKVVGYNCFFTVIEFDKEGKFRHIGAYE